MAHAVTIAAEPAGHAAEQIDDHQDDQDGPECHGILLGGRRTAMIGRTAQEEKHIAPPGSMPEPRRCPVTWTRLLGRGYLGSSTWALLFGLELQRGRVDAVAQAGRT